MSRILQIGYDNAGLEATEEILKSRRYTVVSVRGNTSGARVSASEKPFSLIIVGETSPPWKRRAIVGWLKLEKPGVPVMALHTNKNTAVDQADYNCVLDESNHWLSMVQHACVAGRAQ